MPKPKSLKNSSKIVRSLGGLISLVDPRTYLQLFKLLHFINYSHASQIGRISRGPGCRIAPNVSFANGEHIRLGSNVRIGEYATIWAAEDGAEVVIEDGAGVSPHSLVSAAKYESRSPLDTANRQAAGNPIHIGKGAVIYSYCIILAGSRIGEGATIAPGSLVNGEIPPYAIAMGSPARVVMQRKPPE